MDGKRRRPRSLRGWSVGRGRGFNGLAVRRSRAQERSWRAGAAGGWRGPAETKSSSGDGGLGKRNKTRGFNRFTISSHPDTREHAGQHRGGAAVRPGVGQQPRQFVGSGLVSGSATEFRSCFRGKRGRLAAGASEVVIARNHGVHELLPAEAGASAARVSNEPFDGCFPPGTVLGLAEIPLPKRVEEALESGLIGRPGNRPPRCDLTRPCRFAGRAMSAACLAGPPAWRLPFRQCGGLGTCGFP